MNLAVVLALVLLPAAGITLVVCMLHPRQGSAAHKRWCAAFAVLLAAAMGATVAFLASVER